MSSSCSLFLINKSTTLTDQCEKYDTIDAAAKADSRLDKLNLNFDDRVQGMVDARYSNDQYSWIYNYDVRYTNPAWNAIFLISITDAYIGSESVPGECST